MTRRFLPVILPSAFVLLAAGAFPAIWWRRDADGETRPRGGGLSRLARAAQLAAPVAFVVAVGWLLVRASEPVWHHVEYQGLIPQLEQLAKRFGDDDLVLVESRGSRSDLHVAALPLAYVYARNVLVLNSPRPNRPAFSHFLLWARTHYRNVYFVGSGGTDLALRSVAVAPVATERFQVPEYQSVRNAYPTGARWKEFDFSVYRFVDSAGAPRTLLARHRQLRRPVRRAVQREGAPRRPDVPVDGRRVLPVDSGDGPGGAHAHVVDG